MTNGEFDGTRRAFLRTAGVAGVGWLAGCGTRGGGVVDASTADEGGDRRAVTLLVAGSLQRTFEAGLAPAVDGPVRVEAHGSATVARMVAEGQRDPDIVTVADAALFEAPLSPAWHATFASNAVVLAYDPDTDGGRRVAEAGDDRWYEPLVAGEVSLGRTDPDRDPLGYRALFALELASRYYDDAPNLRAEVPERDQIYPETALLSQFETGAVDAAIVYQNMAVERGYDFVELPPEVNLSDPSHAEEWYATVSYTLPNGREIRGGVVGYASTLRTTSDAAASVFEAQIAGDYLDESGLVLDERFPVYEGDVPDRVHDAGDRSNAASSTVDSTDGPAAVARDPTVGS